MMTGLILYKDHTRAKVVTRKDERHQDTGKTKGTKIQEKPHQDTGKTTSRYRKVDQIYEEYIL